MNARPLVGSLVAMASIFVVLSGLLGALGMEQPAQATASPRYARLLVMCFVSRRAVVVLILAVRECLPTYRL